ncbi:sugar MFS transporter [Pseudaquidulcibacter saccharophilus]|uniref:sugar MFS transporter n=1 Tax=Pseudaquidulcibacter saccharophilus TaxID=2831900 RepID=UPI001EFF5A42|nr:sugar MFS transporter [Pseudaquidulcibacter saccharophilus]
MTNICTNSKSDNEQEASYINAPELQFFVMGLFFIFGGITSLNDVMIPKLKELFSLNYAQVMLVQSAFFAAYFVISIPGAHLVKRIGYMRGAVVGLLTMLVGCLLFIPASYSAKFIIFLLALFVLASGVTIVQVVTNPLISLLGPSKTSHSRLTFAQAFNSLGTTIFPYLGSLIILGGLNKIDPKTIDAAALAVYRATETQVIVKTYLFLALAILIIASVVWMNRNRLVGEKHETGSFFRSFNLLKEKRFGLGVACIFLYVGAEVAIGSLIVNYLMQSHTLGLTEQDAGKHIPLYWGGALIGRFIGSAVLRMFRPGLVLAAVAAGAITLILISSNSSGIIAGYSLLAIGLMNSIMFPTIFSLASENLGTRAADGSGIICVAIVGGAIIPPLTGVAADITHSLAASLTIPALCYLMIASYGFYTSKASS